MIQNSINSLVHSLSNAKLYKKVIKSIDDVIAKQEKLAGTLDENGDIRALPPTEERAKRNSIPNGAPGWEDARIAEMTEKMQVNLKAAQEMKRMGIWDNRKEEHIVKLMSFSDEVSRMKNAGAKLNNTTKSALNDVDALAKDEGFYKARPRQPKEVKKDGK